MCLPQPGRSAPHEPHYIRLLNTGALSLSFYLSLFLCRPGQLLTSGGEFLQKLEKTIPDAAGKVPVHLRSSQIYAHAPIPFQPSAKYDDAKSA